MTFRGKGLLSKARKGVATGPKETRISLPSRFSHFASSLHSNEILRRDPPSPPCFQGEQTRSLICSYFLTFASVYVRSSGFYDDFDISNVDQFTKGRILNFDEFRRLKYRYLEFQNIILHRVLRIEKKKRKKKDEIRRRFLLKGKMRDRYDLNKNLHGVKFLKLSSSGSRM